MMKRINNKRCHSRESGNPEILIFVDPRLLASAKPIFDRLRYGGAGRGDDTFILTELNPTYAVGMGLGASNELV